MRRTAWPSGANPSLHRPGPRTVKGVPRFVSRRGRLPGEEAVKLCRAQPPRIFGAAASLFDEINNMPT